MIITKSLCDLRRKIVITVNVEEKKGIERRFYAHFAFREEKSFSPSRSVPPKEFNSLFRQKERIIRIKLKRKCSISVEYSFNFYEEEE